MSLQQIMLCRYHYDPLDRLASVAPSSEADLLRFYQKNRLATQIQGALQRSVFHHDDQLLAQQQRSGSAVDTTLLATDQQSSVLQLLADGQSEALSYTAYGHQPGEGGLSSLLGFNGEQRDPVTGHYILGSGYRAFNPVLMRFNSPDSFSPFGEGGLNTYAYCAGDPINKQDPTGHMFRPNVQRPSVIVRMADVGRPSVIVHSSDIQMPAAVPRSASPTSHNSQSVTGHTSTAVQGPAASESPGPSMRPVSTVKDADVLSSYDSSPEVIAAKFGELVRLSPAARANVYDALKGQAAESATRTSHVRLNYTEAFRRLNLAKLKLNVLESGQLAGMKQSTHYNALRKIKSSIESLSAAVADLRA